MEKASVGLGAQAEGADEAGHSGAVNAGRDSGEDEGHPEEGAGA